MDYGPKPCRAEPMSSAGNNALRQKKQGTVLPGQTQLSRQGIMSFSQHIFSTHLLLVSLPIRKMGTHDVR